MEIKSWQQLLQVVLKGWQQRVLMQVVLKGCQKMLKKILTWNAKYTSMLMTGKTFPGMQTQFSNLTTQSESQAHEIEYLKTQVEPVNNIIVLEIKKHCSGEKA